MFKKLIAILIFFPMFAFAEAVTIEGYNPDSGSAPAASSPQNIMPPSQRSVPMGSSQQPQYNPQMPMNNQPQQNVPQQQNLQPNSQPPQQMAQPENVQPAPAETAIPAVPTQQAVTVQTVVSAAPQPMAQPINPQEMAKWQEFLNSLAACTVGVFDLRQLDSSLAAIYGNTVNNTINSKQGDLCSVTVNLSKPTGAEVATTTTKPIGGYECLLSKTTINQMINYYSTILKAGSPKSIIDPGLNSSMSKECKLFIWMNGQKSFSVEK